ncbi:MAG: MaoC family dehydratase [Frankiales bacterium]|nr:MaoC family dehydratase [Frankiales bacterium]
MSLDPEFIGRTYPPSPPYEVGREKIREFADALGDDLAAYREPAAARALGYADVIAPPTFPILITMHAAAQIVADPALGLDYTKVVHGAQRFEYTRPLQAGDVVEVVVSVDDIRAAGGNDILTTRAEVRTLQGEHLVTALSTLVARGTASA